MPDTAPKQLRSFISGVFDAMNAEDKARERAAAAVEEAARMKAAQLTATLDPQYAGFGVVTAQELALLRWAKMQVQIRELQYESGRILENVTKFVDPSPHDMEITKRFS